MSWSRAGDELRTLAPTLVFLAAVLVIAQVADAAGLFDWAGGRMAAARTSGRVLYVVVAVVALAVTTTLSLDATAALLTPVVIRATRRRDVATAPYALATVQLANGGSLLLPVANLTNLIVWPLTGLGFLAFGVHLLLPCVLASAVIIGGIALLHRRDLSPPSELRVDDAPIGATSTQHSELDGVARGVAVAIAVLLVSFAVASFAGIEPAWIAAAGAVVLSLALLRADRTSPSTLARAISPDLLVFVAGLAVLVAALDQHGVSDRLADVLPSGTSFVALLTVAVVAAVLANTINNLPATLVLAAAVGHAPATLLAVLLGVNIGPNVTPTGSLATLLWQRAVHTEDADVSTRTFVRTGAIVTPVALVAAVVGLWATLAVASL